MVEHAAPYMNINQLMEVLPHRYPFLLIDTIQEFHPGPDPQSRVGQWVMATKNVTINEPFFPGHFPHKPIMPGVLLIEAMAQAGAIAFYRREDKAQDFAIAYVKSAKFRKPVVPGDTLNIRAEIQRDRGTMTLIQCECFVRGQKVAEAEVMASVTRKSVDGVLV